MPNRHPSIAAAFGWITSSLYDEIMELRFDLPNKRWVITTPTFEPIDHLTVTQMDFNGAGGLIYEDKYFDGWLFRIDEYGKPTSIRAIANGRITIVHGSPTYDCGPTKGELLSTP